MGGFALPLQVALGCGAPRPLRSYGQSHRFPELEGLDAQRWAGPLHLMMASDYCSSDLSQVGSGHSLWMSWPVLRLKGSIDSKGLCPGHMGERSVCLDIASSDPGGHPLEYQKRFVRRRLAGPARRAYPLLAGRPGAGL